MRSGIIPRLLGMAPLSLRRAVIGSPDHPSRVATFLHNLLNRVPVEPDEIFECRGDLQGYRMHTDWRRFRGLVYGNWEPAVSAVVLSNLEPGMTVLDIGGHIGYFTLLLAKCVGKTGRIFSFEPMLANFEMLQKNIDLNGLSQAQAIPMAVYSKVGEVTIAIPDGHQNTGDSSLVYAVGSRQAQVQATTIDAFCVERRLCPKFIKMDVEGAEYEVLLGAEDTIRECRPKMLIELHHFDGNWETNRVPKLLMEWGFTVKWIERFAMTSHVLAIPEEQLE